MSPSQTINTSPTWGKKCRLGVLVGDNHGIKSVVWWVVLTSLQETLVHINFENVPVKNRLHLDSNQFSKRIHHRTKLVDEGGDLLGRPGTVLSVVSGHFFRYSDQYHITLLVRPHCHPVQGWGFLVFCPHRPGADLVFLTTSEEPQHPLTPDVPGVVELETDPAPRVQVIHNDRPDSQGEFRLYLGSLHIGEHLVIGYCLPRGALVKVFLNDRSISPALEETLEFFFAKKDTNVSIYYDKTYEMVYVIFLGQRKDRSR